MQIYLVGGAVRDKVLGVEPKDNDFVMVGATAQDLIDMGLRQVGKDHPSFIGKMQGNDVEVSLARRSRVGGVADFGPEVTLEEDLSKRDLTINAMALGGTVDQPRFVDPFGGRADLENKTLRMVSAASFVEDPIRVLRVARFAARYPDFKIDQQTMHIMKSLVMDGKLDNLVPERVWKELSRGLMEVAPSRMLKALRFCGALEKILPEVYALYGVPQPEQHHPEIDTGRHIEQVLDYAASQNFPLEVRYAALLHDVGKASTPSETWPAHHGHEALGAPLVRRVNERLRVPTDMGEIAYSVAVYHGQIHGAMKIKVTSVVKLLRLLDAFRRPERFQLMLQAAMCDARGRHSDTVSFADVEYPQAMRLSAALWATQGIDAGAVAKHYQDTGRPQFIPAAIHAERARAVRRFEKQYHKG